MPKLAWYERMWWNYEAGQDPASASRKRLELLLYSMWLHFRYGKRW